MKLILGLKLCNVIDVILTVATSINCVSTKDFKDRKKFEGKLKKERCALNDFVSMHHFGYGTVHVLLLPEIKPCYLYIACTFYRVAKKAGPLSTVT